MWIGSVSTQFRSLAARKISLRQMVKIPLEIGSGGKEIHFPVTEKIIFLFGLKTARTTRPCWWGMDELVCSKDRLFDRLGAADEVIKMPPGCSSFYSGSRAPDARSQKHDPT